MSTRWTLVAGNALDQPGDALVCPANVYLNLSGGVGADILLRCGDAMQRELHAGLAESGRRFVQQGDIVVTSGAGTGFAHVLHAVAVDGFYRTSVETVSRLVEASLMRAAELGSAAVVLTALGTGHGRLPIAKFGAAVRPLVGMSRPPIERVTICVRREAEADEIRRALG